jgi:plasmid stabilization system protein ParE
MHSIGTMKTPVAKERQSTPGVLRFPAGSYLIYYRKKRGLIQILHVFHAAREQASAFKNDCLRDDVRLWETSPSA